MRKMRGAAVGRRGRRGRKACHLACPMPARRTLTQGRRVATVLRAEVTRVAREWHAVVGR